jgi:hypothetical protein
MGRFPRLPNRQSTPHNVESHPRGDREGDLISVEQDRCRIASGPLIGGVLVEAIIWEWDKTKTNAVLLSGSGVIRKPGSTVAFQITEGKLAVTITDGKVTGATSSGRGPREGGG